MRKISGKLHQIIGFEIDETKENEIDDTKKNERTVIIFEKYRQILKEDEYNEQYLKSGKIKKRFHKKMLDMHGTISKMVENFIHQLCET